MGFWEARRPFRHLDQPLGRRYIANFSLVFFNTIVAKILMIVFTPLMAYWVQSQDFGLLPLLSLKPWVSFILSIVLLDLIIYFQHRIFHFVPFFWRFHAVHHSDENLDFSSAGRFHPVEIGLSLLVKGMAIMILGPAVWAVVIFESILNGSATFNHANIKLPTLLSNKLEKLIVTPKMHRIHHSVVRRESDTNFGFCFSVWDRLFSTYTLKDGAGDRNIDIGLVETKNINTLNFLWMLKCPFGKLFK